MSLIPPRVGMSIALALGCASALLPAHAEEVLTVEAVAGHGSVERVGERNDLKPGDHLTERDLVRTHSDSRMSLRFPHNGFAEMGPDTVLAVEKLPFASYATDLKSIFTLSQGYLRLVWKRPAESTSWPIYIFFGGQRAAVASGEYFFDARPGSARVCVAAGQVTVVPIGGASSETLRAPACYRLASGRSSESTAIDPERWIAVRRDFSLDPPSSSEAELASTETANPALSPSDVPPQESPGVAAKPAPAPTVVAAAPAKPPVPSVPVAAVSGSPASRPAPPSSPAPSAIGPGNWIINIASYPDAETANTQVEQMHAAGYEVAVRPAAVKGRTWYRVQLTDFPTQEAARAKADEVQTRLGFKSLWIIRAP